MKSCFRDIKIVLFNSEVKIKFAHLYATVLFIFIYYALFEVNVEPVHQKDLRMKLS